MFDIYLVSLSSVPMVSYGSEKCAHGDTFSPRARVSRDVTGNRGGSGSAVNESNNKKRLNLSNAAVEWDAFTSRIHKKSKTVFQMLDVVCLFFRACSFFVFVFSVAHTIHTNM